MPPLIVPHYTAATAAAQKIGALVGRPRPQARDLFDLWVLGPYVDDWKNVAPSDAETLTMTRDRVFSISFDEFRDAVVAYMAAQDQAVHESRQLWDEIRLQVLARIEGD